MNYLEMANYAVNNSVAYQKKYSSILHGNNLISEENFKLMPLLRKKEVQTDINSIICGNVYGTEGFFQRYKTSGTTGVPLHIYWRDNEYVKSMMYLWLYRRKWYGICPDYRYATFHSVVSQGGNTKKEDVLFLHQDRVMSLGRYVYSEETMQYYFYCWQAFDPDWIQAPPSVMLLFATYKEKTGVSLKKLRYIELVGEYVTCSTQAYISKVFGVPVANMYGSVEFNGIGLTCPYGHMHILENNVHLEIVNCKENDMIVITGLNNTYMPLVRYQIGDMGQIYNLESCACGKSGQCLTLKRGRVHNLITLEKNTFLDPDIMTNIVERLNINELVVQQFDIVKKNDILVLRVFVSEKYQSKITTYKMFLLNEMYAYKPKNLRFDIEVVKEPLVFGDGKKFTFFKGEMIE